MAATEDYGIMLLAALCDHSSPSEMLLEAQLAPEYFDSTKAADAYEYIKHHMAKHGTVPHRDIVSAETGVTLPEEVVGEFSYYVEKVEQEYIHSTLTNVLVDKVQDTLNHGTPSDALEALSQAVLDLQRFEHRDQMFNYKEKGWEMVMSDFKKKVSAPDGMLGISTGWDYLDDMVGGLVGGDFMGIVGRPAAGKTYLALSIANHIWRNQNKVPLLVSMEMNPLIIMQRVSAMNFQVPITGIKKGEMTSNLRNQMAKGLAAMSKDPDVPDYWILDGNLTAKVSDLIMAAQQIQPDVVIVDGAYLLGAEDRRMPKWQQIGENAEAMKMKIASRLGIPVIASYQLNRDYMKDLKNSSKGKGDNKEMAAPGVEHIAGADAIGQIASVIIGLMEKDDIQTMRRRTVSILKGRSGETGSWDINWIFDVYPYMDFSEIKKGGQEKVEEDGKINFVDDETKPLTYF